MRTCSGVTEWQGGVAGWLAGGWVEERGGCVVGVSGWGHGGYLGAMNAWAGCGGFECACVAHVGGKVIWVEGMEPFGGRD